jgi:hypothetical protein
MLQAVDEVSWAKGVVKRHASDAVEQTSQVHQVKLLHIPRINAQQLQSCLLLLHNKSLFDESR